ncbi:MAG TPA: hypothetical protein VFH37_03015 [Candidatus Saccharimonadales bacterium]|nr:hypothetical protein [Candidatus Saccharimonadales bacterium]
METQIDILQDDDSTTHIVSWRKGKPPEENEKLNRELDHFPEGIVLVNFGEVSYIIDLDPGAEPDGVLDIFRSHGYEVRRALVG